MHTKRELSVFDKHQLKIARDTLKMSDVGARIMGGMTKAEAADVIFRLTGKHPIVCTDSGLAADARNYFSSPTHLP